MVREFSLFCGVFWSLVDVWCLDCGVCVGKDGECPGLDVSAFGCVWGERCGGDGDFFVWDVKGIREVSDEILGIDFDLLHQD